MSVVRLLPRVGRSTALTRDSYDSAHRPRIAVALLPGRNEDGSLLSGHTELVGGSLHDVPGAMDLAARELCNEGTWTDPTWTRSQFSSEGAGLQGGEELVVDGESEPSLRDLLAGLVDSARELALQ